MNFYEKLREIIPREKMSDKQLADECGIAQSQLSKWKQENKIPGGEIIIKICEKYKISSDYLLGLDEAPPPKVVSDEEYELLRRYRQSSEERKEIINGILPKEEESSALKNIS